MDRPNDQDTPLDLGVVGDPRDGKASASSVERTSSSRRWWAVVAIASVAGAVVGGAVVQARDDAAQYAEANVVGSQMAPLITQPGGEYAGGLRVSLFNAGERQVEVLGFEADGLTVVRGADLPDPVSIASGRWVEFVQTGLDVDCDLPPPSVFRIRVRTDGGDEQVAELNLPPGAGPVELWSWSCR